MIVMATLGPKASAVVDAARSALRATDADRERIEAALRARLGPAALPAKAALLRVSYFRPKPRRFAWRFIPPTVGVFVIGGALSLAVRPGSRPIVEQKPAPARTPEVIGPATLSAGTTEHLVSPAEPPAEVATPAASSVHPLHASTSSPSARPGQDQLMLEVALLARATSALHSGHAGDALKALNEHQREFPSGLLSAERRGAKAQALCLLGRVAEGRAELAQLSSQPLAASRVKLVCDAAATAAQAKPD
jgi:hypothetical protein